MGEYISLPSHSDNHGSRRAQFMGLGRKLQNLGFSDSEIMVKLVEADHDGARAANNDIEKVMKTLSD